ncbi:MULTISPECIES: peroxidase family protein [unclassified Streptosporangium]|uniref:peroxidase family protein n=1 Tax=unclassified Streptosporangium TaxID=2632669 RepID=UPI002E27C135|nr:MULTISPECIES: peroxidase family protein [unclassified Streptosporangium]
MFFTVPQSIARELPRFLNAVGRIPLVRRAVSTVVIEVLAGSTSPRPRALSMADDYTSWKSLTDRTFSGRHLPPILPSPEELPSEESVNDLFRRRKDERGEDVEIESTDTSVMFMFFAQWFTDSFLRTSREDFRKNTSTQEIDLCQIYGLTEEKTHLLRAHQDGRLKSQLIDGEEYPEFLFKPRSPGKPPVFKPEFEGLHDPEFIIKVLLEDAPEKQKDLFFAVGLEHGNSTIGNTIMNVVFLREHNRIAGLLKKAHPEWADRPEGADPHLFETTRNIMIVLLLKLVVEEYVRHISPYDFPLEAVPFIADGKRWNRSNWVSIEFNLLYRWHSLVPSTIGSGPDRLESTGFRNNNPLVLSRGIESLISQCSRERAGRIGLMNTPHFLVDRDPAHPDRPSVQERTIALARKAQLASYNDYRENFGLGRLKDFGQLTKDTDLRGRLEKLYDDDIDKLEWYVGIFAEDYSRDEMMGRLMTTMVAYDAFTQALTNPLLARNVFNEATFTGVGLDLIKKTKSLQQIVARNSTSPESVRCTFRC